MISKAILCFFLSSNLIWQQLKNIDALADSYRGWYHPINSNKKLKVFKFREKSKKDANNSFKYEWQMELLYFFLFQWFICSFDDTEEILKLLFFTNIQLITIWCVNYRKITMNVFFIEPNKTKTKNSYEDVKNEKWIFRKNNI